MSEVPLYGQPLKLSPQMPNAHGFDVIEMAQGQPAGELPPPS